MLSCLYAFKSSIFKGNQREPKVPFKIEVFFCIFKEGIHKNIFWLTIRIYPIINYNPQTN